MDFTDLSPLLDPKIVAVIGASDNPHRIGGRALAYMLERKFEGELLPVNPNRDRVQGLKAYGSITDVVSVPDIAIIALPAPLVPDTIDQLIERGTKSAVIFSSGFGEVGEAGATLQEEVYAKCRAGGIRLLGPNSLGLYNVRTNFWGTFTISLELGWPQVGRIGIASQSGAYGSYMSAASVKRGLGNSVFVATGNEADITTADAIGWMAEDENTDVIISYIEGIKDGPRLIAALEKARDAKKPVFMMKAGRSKLGAKAAQTHTASLVGNDAVADAVFQDLGVVRVKNTQQVLDYAEAAGSRIYPANNTLGVLTISGGAGILIADDAEKLSLPMPEMPESAQKNIKEMLSFAAARNPVDCTAQVLNDLSLVGKFGIQMIESGGYKSLLIFFGHAGGAKSILSDLRAELRRISQAAPDCLCFFSVLASEEMITQFREDGFLVYDDPSRAVEAIAAMGRLGDAFATPPSKNQLDIPVITQLHKTPNEVEAKNIFAKAGICVPAETLCTTVAEVEAAAKITEFPVVMKIVSKDILHKTEIGGVATGVATIVEARKAFEQLIANVYAARPDASIDGVLVAEQVPGGVECIMGVMLDPVFGPVAMFGLGGVYVEILNDVVLRQCPFNKESALELIGRIRGIDLLRGTRGQPPVNLDALAEMLSRLSLLACSLGENLVSIDVNPVIATADGAWAVDAVIEIDPN